MLAEVPLRTRARSLRGNMLALMGASTFILALLILFALWYISNTMGTTAHRTAIESAALAAVGDLGRIVVNTPEVGYVSLTGCPPVGGSNSTQNPPGDTIAQDNWFQQARGINELLATSRVDLILADQMNDPYLYQLAVNDRANVLKAKDELLTALSAACQPGGCGYDIYGNKVAPYDDALSMYLSNSSVKTSYVVNSMQLQLGSIQGGVATATSIPNPQNLSYVGNGQQLQGYYLSETSIPYKDQDFVFASVTKQAALADSHKFVSQIAALPYQIPAALLVSAKQQFHDQNTTQTTQFSACATAGGAFKSPTPGALTISFPDGALSEVSKPGDLTTWKDMNSVKCDVLEAVGGDFPDDRPQAALAAPTDWQVPANPTAANIYRVSLHDWVREAGSTINIQSVKDMANLAFNQANPSQVLWVSLNVVMQPITIGMIPQGIMHIYEFDSSGNVTYKSKLIQPEPYLNVDNDQLYAENLQGQELKTSSANWSYIIQILPTQKNPNFPNVPTSGPHHIKGSNKVDIYFRDELHQYGALKGGKHVGEPLNTNYISHAGQPAAGISGLKPASAICDLTSAGRTGRSKAAAAVPAMNDLAWSGDYGAGGVGGGGTGTGLPPAISEQEDFALTTVQPPVTYISYTDGPPGGQPRPSYTANGMSCDIRFRRVLDFHEWGFYFGFNSGYVGLMLDPSQASGSVSTGYTPPPGSDTSTSTSTTTTTTTSGP